MKIGTVTVIQNAHGADEIFVETDYPNPEYPFTGFLTLKFRAAANTGPQYVKDHFDRDPIVIQRQNTMPLARK